MGGRRARHLCQMRPAIATTPQIRTHPKTPRAARQEPAPDPPPRSCGTVCEAIILAADCRSANGVSENYPKLYGQSRMPATPDDLFAFLDRLGITHATVTHPPLFTVEQSQALRGTIPGGHTKNLFLKDKKDAVFLVVAPEEGHVDLKTLHHKLGAGRFSFGSADLMLELLGVSPGAVTAFGVINDTKCRVNVVLHAGLMENAIINCPPLVNT